MSSFDQDLQKAAEAEVESRPHSELVSQPSSVAKPADTILTKPAKSASSATHKEMTGNAYVDVGLACEGEKPGNGDCFLDAGARQRVIGAFHARVNAAHLAYMSALTQLGVEELLKKEPQQSEWVMDLLLDVIGAVTSNIALKIFRLAIGGGHAIEGVAASAADVSHGLHSHGEALFKEGFGTAVSIGKKETAAAHSAYGDPSKPEAGTEKAANVGYIDMLKDQSGAIFENIREDMIAGIDDARLLVLFDSFRAANHTVSAYKAALAKKLQRFASSGVGKMGISANSRDDGRLVGGDYGLDAASQHERHAYWVTTPSGRHLGIYRRAYKEPKDTVRETSGADRNLYPWERLADEMQRRTNEEGFVFDGFVANEFVDAAVKLHAARWGYQPRERVAGPYELAQMFTKDDQS